MNICMKKRGFSLSEVLVAMSVVGIISALVIPGIVRDYNRSGFEKLLGSFYNDFVQAMTIAQAETFKNLVRSPLATGDSGGLLRNYMQVKTDCEDARTPCFADTYQDIDGTTSVASSSFCTTGKSFVLSNGMAVCITPMTTTETILKDNSAEIYVDVNGADKPNIGGKDLFRMNLYSDATVDEQAKPSVRASLDRTDVAEKCTTSATGEGCFTQFMRDGMKFNYYD